MVGETSWFSIMSQYWRQLAKWFLISSHVIYMKNIYMYYSDHSYVVWVDRKWRRWKHVVWELSALCWPTPVMYCLVDYFNSVIKTISISVLSSPLFYSRRLPSAVTWAIVIRIGAILQWQDYHYIWCEIQTDNQGITSLAMVQLYNFFLIWTWDMEHVVASPWNLKIIWLKYLLCWLIYVKH